MVLMESGRKPTEETMGFKPPEEDEFHPAAGTGRAG
jgi:hypothetical protein